jgi:hypothetical protein
MASPTTPPTTKTTRYIILGLVAIPALVLLYFALSYLAVNLFIGLDLSAYGQLAAGGWLGYVLLGLGLGAAGGTVAAQQRYRLHRGLLVAAGVLALGLGLLAGATLANATQVIEATATDAQLYKSLNKRVSCGACTAISATTTRPAQNDNAYEASNLLSRDSTNAWISETAVDPRNPLLPTTQLHLTIAPLAGHRLAGLRLRNGYCKNNGVYQGFSRVQSCQVQLATSQPQAWTLADVPRQEFYLPLPAASRDTARVTVTISSSYPGDSHPEVALAWLVPVFEPVAP